MSHNLTIASGIRPTRSIWQYGQHRRLGFGLDLAGFGCGAD
jgi:hypothetical protein